ncbi:MAG: guanylate kinase [Deltaproteobacteria bacterium]|nr:guanylate kinase [Deltaproteobacteria bacterium]
MNRDAAGQSEGLFIVVSAPSGTGKTSILKALMQNCPNIMFSVSYTTRPPRPGEVDGRDYHFISEQEFRERIAAGEFAEWVENYGQLYGTSGKTMRAFLEQGFDLMLDVEARGAQALKTNYPGGIFVFVLPPSLAELRKRLGGRGCESEEAMKRRLDKAVDEIREIGWYDYVIFNDRLEDAVDRLRSIYVAEKSRRERLTERIEGFLA